MKQVPRGELPKLSRSFVVIDRPYLERRGIDPTLAFDLAVAGGDREENRARVGLAKPHRWAYRATLAAGESVTLGAKGTYCVGLDSTSEEREYASSERWLAYRVDAWLEDVPADASPITATCNINPDLPGLLTAGAPGGKLPEDAQQWHASDGTHDWQSETSDTGTVGMFAAAWCYHKRLLGVRGEYGKTDEEQQQEHAPDDVFSPQPGVVFCQVRHVLALHDVEHPSPRSRVAVIDDRHLFASMILSAPLSDGLQMGCSFAWGRHWYSPTEQSVRLTRERCCIVIPQYAYFLLQARAREFAKPMWEKSVPLGAVELARVQTTDQEPAQVKVCAVVSYASLQSCPSLLYATCTRQVIRPEVSFGLMCHPDSGAPAHHINTQISLACVPRPSVELGIRLTMRARTSNPPALVKGTNTVDIEKEMLRECK